MKLFVTGLVSFCVIYLYILLYIERIEWRGEDKGNIISFRENFNFNN